MAATYKAVFPACGPAVWAADGRRAYRGGTSGPSFDPDAQAYFARAGITDTAKMTAINAFILGIKFDFTITTLDEVFDQILLNANESAAAAVIDMTSNQYDGVLVNSPTFAQWLGVTNTGNTNYINTGFNPSTDGIRYTRNSKTYGFFVRTFTAYVQQQFGANVPGYESYAYLDSGGSRYFRDANGGGAVSVTGGNTTGHFALSRTASNLITGYYNGASFGTAADASIANINLDMHTHGLNNNGSHSGAPSGLEFSMEYFSRGMSAGEAAAFNARVQTLKTAIGW